MIKGNIIRLNTLHLNSASMNGVREVQGSSASGGGGIAPIPPVVPPSKEYIQFEDKAVEAICVANWSSDGIGLTKEDAAKVTSLSVKFRGNKTIEKFEELRYFTGLTSFIDTEFRGCSSLKVIAFPPQITSTSINQFNGCTSLEEVKTDTPIKVMEMGTFYGCSAFVRIDTSELEEMKNTQTGNGVFYGCAFTDFNAPKLKTIGTVSFTSHFQNSKLEKVISMGEVSEFPDCNINYGIFKDSNLAEIEIPATTTKLGNYLFYNCSKLSKVICRASTPPSLGSNALQGTNSALVIYVPDASLEAYKTATNWNTYADRIHPLSEIEGAVIEHGVSLTNYGTLKTNANYSVVGFVKTNGATSIKWGVTGGELGLLCEYTKNGTFQDYWGAQTNPRTVTIQSSSTQVKAAFSTANLDNAYIYDNTNGIYLWKGKNVE